MKPRAQLSKTCGRVLEDLGIGVLAGSIVAVSIVDFRFWYFLIVGATLVLGGIWLQDY